MQYIKDSTFMNFLRHNAKATAKRSRPCENILRSFVNGGADLSGGSLSTCIHRPKPESLAAVQILCVGFSGQPTDRMEQTASSCTHALHSPLRGLENWRWLHESTSLRYIYTFLSLNYNIGKTNRANKFKHFAKIFWPPFYSRPLYLRPCVLSVSKSILLQTWVQISFSSVYLLFPW